MADRINTFDDDSVDRIDRLLKAQSRGTPPLPPQQARPPQVQTDVATIVPVLNTGGLSIRHHGVIGIDGPARQPQDANGAGFYDTLSLKGGIPDKAKHRGRFAILLETSTPGYWADAVVSGVVQCKVMLNDLSHRFADIVDGTGDHLESCASGGAAEILATQNAPVPQSLVWATVRIVGKTVTHFSAQVWGGADGYHFDWREVAPNITGDALEHRSGMRSSETSSQARTYDGIEFTGGPIPAPPEQCIFADMWEYTDADGAVSFWFNTPIGGLLNVEAESPIAVAVDELNPNHITIRHEETAEFLGESTLVDTVAVAVDGNKVTITPQTVEYDATFGHLLGMTAGEGIEFNVGLGVASIAGDDWITVNSELGDDPDLVQLRHGLGDNVDTYESPGLEVTDNLDGTYTFTPTTVNYDQFGHWNQNVDGDPIIIDTTASDYTADDVAIEIASGNVITHKDSGVEDGDFEVLTPGTGLQWATEGGSGIAVNATGHVTSRTPGTLRIQPYYVAGALMYTDVADTSVNWLPPPETDGVFHLIVTVESGVVTFGYWPTTEGCGE